MAELRWHPLLQQWVVVAGHRQERTYKPPASVCPLCPTRDPAHPTEIPDADFDIAVFENRFPSFVESPPPPEVVGTSLSPVAPAQGVAEVVVYSPDHDRTLAEQPVEHIRKLVEVWAHRYEELGRRAFVKYVMIFENRGEAVGVTLHHPHGQIYAFPFIPPIPEREIASSRAHLEKTGRCLLCDVLSHEERPAAVPGGSSSGPSAAKRPGNAGIAGANSATRVVVSSGSFVAFVPFFARFPFEAWVVPRRHVPSILQLGNAQRWDLASVLKQLLMRYDALFGVRLPYMMVMHQAPTDRPPEEYPECHFHVEFLPIQRTADKLKYLAGSESGAGTFITDMSPEEMAHHLRQAGG
ncbi:MAG: galactose-1-phosphate uridylyltransferase [Limnochordaceae bacterium]|nr:galactose-1-phosphate uridylyltransferase [Limnochordaceae bacterium]